MSSTDSEIKIDSLEAEKVLYTFLSVPLSRVWLNYKHGQYYVKKQVRCINKALYNTLELNNVIIEDKYRGTGEFREFLTAMHLQPDFNVLYIETVVSKRLEQILQKHGWLLQKDIEYGSMNYYKILT